MKKAIFLLLVFGTLSASPEEDFEKIFQIHSKSLPYLDQPNDKLVILFSGVPAMGKTTVAKKLEEALHGVRISGDEVRDIIRQLWAGGNVDPILDPYFEWLLQKIDKSYPNHLLIIDRSIDRKYDAYFPFIKKFSYDSFLIRMVVSRPLVEERIRQRGINVEYFLKDMNSFWADYERFNQNHTADFLFNNENQPEIGELIENIYSKIRLQ